MHVLDIIFCKMNNLLSSLEYHFKEAMIPAWTNTYTHQ